ncbi:MAG TPA: ABC transporter permease [Gemmataceae bacterium]|nr:ABC transporter permease [Gemmataceae bacterium]
MTETPAIAPPPHGTDPTPAPPVHRTVIEPPTGWQLVDVRELWRFRELVFFLVWRDIKVRYKQAVLGVAWAVLQPAMLMVVFSVFLGRLAGLSGGGVPYPLFVLTGLIAWTFFASAVSQGGNSVVGSERLITKIYFPRLAIPFASVGAAVFDFVISLGLLGALMAYYGFAPSWQVVFAPLVFGVVLLAAAGLGTLLAALTVLYRDFRYVTPFLIQVGMYATPTIYMLLPADPSPGLKAWLAVNPMVAPVAAFRACLLGGPIPWESFAVSAAVAVGLFVLGCLYFRKVEDDFADNI